MLYHLTVDYFLSQQCLPTAVVSKELSVTTQAEESKQKR